MKSSDSKTIYVDLDDVLCHAARHFLKIVEREFGKRVAYEQLTDFDIGESCGLSTAERDELYRIVHQPEELLSMAPVKEAVAVLRRWEESGFEIAIVTGRPPGTRDVSLAWLKRHQFPFHSLTIVDKYARFSTEQREAIDLAQLANRQFCWAVEDSLPVAQYLADRMEVPVALIERPWNQSADTHVRISRYRDWRALAEARPEATNGGRKP